MNGPDGRFGSFLVQVAAVIVGLAAAAHGFTVLHPEMTLSRTAFATAALPVHNSMPALL
jgi:hypothetical protein